MSLSAMASQSSRRLGRPWLKSRRTILLLIAISSLLYVAVFLSIAPTRYRLQKTAPSSSTRLSTNPSFRLPPGPVRLIAFGDSWSDDGHYPLHALSGEDVLARHKLQGRTWTEWLCSTVRVYVQRESGVKYAD